MISGMLSACHAIRQEMVYIVNIVDLVYMVGYEGQAVAGYGFRVKKEKKYVEIKWK